MTSYERYPETNPAYLTVVSVEGRVPDLNNYMHGYPGKLLTGEMAVRAIDAYSAAGERLRVPNIPEDELFVADRVLLSEPNGLDTTWRVIRDRLDPEAVPSRTEGVGHYYVNNQKLSYVNEFGELVVARCAVPTIDALRAAGYSERSVQVPFSNAEMPVPDSMADLHLRLFDALNRQDEYVHGGTNHTVDFIDPDGAGNLAIRATRSAIHIGTTAGSDLRVTRAMDPDLGHDIQTLRDRIAFLRQAELSGE